MGIRLVGFGMYSSPDTVYYYVMDTGVSKVFILNDNRSFILYKVFTMSFNMISIGNSLYITGYMNVLLVDPGASKVYILNDKWSLISAKVFTMSFNMISIDNSLYMTGYSNVWKVDKDLNILINYNPGVDGYPAYDGISYNPSNWLIYVAATVIKEIQVFNLDLTLIRRISTSPHIPWSITISSNQLYVGANGGIVLVYQNETLINQFNGCNGNSDLVTSILFDPNGYMATTCLYYNKLYLFSPDGSFTNKSISTPQYPLYIGFDSKGRFILISSYQISIYK